MITALAFTLALSLAPQDDPAKAVPAWIDKLRSDRIDDRDQATQELKKLGKAAIPELEKVAADKDVEVAARARTLLRLIRIKELFGIDLKDFNDMPATQLVEWMEKKTGRKFLFTENLGLRNAKVRIPEELLDTPDPYVLGVDLLRILHVGVSPSDSAPGAMELFAAPIGGKKGLKVYKGVEELPRANEFCTLVLHPRHVSPRVLQAVLINVVSFPQNCLSVEDSGTLILSDYTSVLRKCVEIMNGLDVSRAFRVGVTLLEAKAGKEPAIPEPFRNLRLVETTGLNQFSVMGAATCRLERMAQNKPGVAAPPGNSVLRFAGASPFIVEFDGGVRAAGGPALERFTLRRGEAPERLLETRLELKDENWTFAGAVPLDKEGTTLVVLVRAVQD